ncbi:MAG: hypothetical protein HQM10_27095 [Candidatus Riflebacteria bacterium]|nr:hypothetical protein [Candidatus Riflebacteria bacterium]
MNIKFTVCLFLFLSLTVVGWTQTDDNMTAEQRTRLGLPLADGDPKTMIHPNSKDEKSVASLPAEVFTAIDGYVKVCRNKDFKSKGKVYATRKVGEYFLLWVTEPDVMDGGFELIYSIEKNRIVGTFFGGYKG